MPNLADDVYRTIREYRTYLETGTQVTRRGIAALRFSGAAAIKELKTFREQLEQAVLAALRNLALKPADLFELLFLARRRDWELGLRTDRDVEGGVECVRAEVLGELDSALDRLAHDNVESAGRGANIFPGATDVEGELMRSATKLLDDLLCSCSPPSQHELWQFWLDVGDIEQLIACLRDLQLGTWAVKLGQAAQEAAKATDEFRESTWRKMGGWEAPDHDFLISQECGCRIGLAEVLCEIRQKLRRIGEGRRHQGGDGAVPGAVPRCGTTAQGDPVFAAITPAPTGLSQEGRPGGVKDPGAPLRKDHECREALAKRAEDYVRNECNGVFPGLRPLARFVGGGRVSSLVNAIKSSKYLSARKAEYDANRKPKARQEKLTDVHMDRIAQSTEPDPAETLDELIDEQAADDRNDDRMAKLSERYRSR